MKGKRKLLIAIVVILAAGLYYYVALPAFNIHSSDTWFFIIFLLVVVAVIYAVRKKIGKAELRTSKTMKFFGFAILGLGIIYLVGSLLSSPIVNAKKYQKLMKVEEGEFTEDIK